jgi:hypothetical protein
VGSRRVTAFHSDALQPLSSSPKADGKSGAGSDSEDSASGVVVKKSGFSAAKPLLSTKVALPHHLAPLQVCDR